MHKKNIAILTGGDSLESASSYASAETVFNALSATNYNRFIIELVDWKFKILAADGMTSQMLDSAIFHFDSFTFVIPESGQTLTFDCAFIAIHGEPGESGHLQSYFDMIKIPYTGSRLFSTALAMHKFECTSFLNAAAAIKKPKQLLLGAFAETEKIEAVIGFPCILKPDSYGSGIGVTKVHDSAGLMDAFDRINKLGQTVLVEEFINGTEVTVGMIITRKQVMTLPVAEIVRPTDIPTSSNNGNIYFTDRQNVEKLIPARISEELHNSLSRITKEIGILLDCRSFFRADFIISQDGTPYFLELNTIPGMTPKSVFTQQLLAAGISLAEFYTGIVEDALT